MPWYDVLIFMFLYAIVGVGFLVALIVVWANNNKK